MTRLRKFSKRKFFPYLIDFFAGGSWGDVGAYGERRAASFLKYTKGYKIIARNWRAKKDELDIICRDGQFIVLVEVKTRQEDALVSGFHAVGGQKKEALRRGFRAFLKKKPAKANYTRFDIVEVRLSKSDKSVNIQHYQGVPLFCTR